MSLQESQETLAAQLTRNLTTQLREAADQAEGKSDLVTWIKRNFYIPETKFDPVLRGRIGLEKYQEDVLREALTPLDNGNFKYSIIVWSDIKKSAKSTIAASVNFARAWHTEFGEFHIVANDLKQADSRVAHYLRRAISLNKKIKPQVRIAGYKTTLPNGTFIEAIPIDPSGEAGSNSDQVTFSELWGANEDAKQVMWAELTIPPNKYGKAFRWVESYAGTVGESLLLYSLYDLGVKQGELLWPDRLYPVTDGEPTPLELYVNREAGMLCLWNTQPRCPWQTKEYYASEAKILTPNQFLRLHRNQWVSSTESFVPMEWWDMCNHSGDWPEIPHNHPMVVALDAAVSGDCFGMLAGCRHPQEPDTVLTIYSRKWTPDRGQKLDYRGTEDNPGPERELEKFVASHNVVQVAYDEYQLHDLSMRWRQKDNAVWWKPFGQGDERLIADNQFRELIRDRRIWHRGEPDLREHIQNADAKTDTEDRKIRIVKRAEKLKVDLAVCASMMSSRVLYLNIDK